MKLSRIPILVLSLGLALVLTVMGCSRSAKTERSVKTKDAIEVGLAVTKEVPIQIRVTGHVTLFAAVAIKSQVDGKLE